MLILPHQLVLDIEEREKAGQEVEGKNPVTSSGVSE